jgi:hypothetical protein
MVVGFLTTYAINAYHHKHCEFEPPFRWGELDTTLCDKVRQWLAIARWFSLGSLVSSTSKADCQDISEILLKVALNTINLNTKETALKQDKIKDDSLTRNYSCLITRKVLSSFKPLHNCRPCVFSLDLNDLLSFTITAPAKLKISYFWVRM